MSWQPFPQELDFGRPNTFASRYSSPPSPSQGVFLSSISCHPRLEGKITNPYTLNSSCQTESLLRPLRAMSFNQGQASPSHSDENHDSTNMNTSTTSRRTTSAMSLSFIVDNPTLTTPQADEVEIKTEASSPIVKPAAEPRVRQHDSMSKLLNNVCAREDCDRLVRGAAGSFCKYHKQSRFCRSPGCTKSAKTGGYCISHGGGKRCAVEECIKSAKQGGYCIAHGGGKRCQVPECTKSALVGGFCSAHGGGRKCSKPECTKTALQGGLCIGHGGGKRCQKNGCTKSAVGGTFCTGHGGGKRCQVDGCTKGAVRQGKCIRHGAKKEA